MKGIYCIKNIVNNKVYIGKALDILNRLENGHRKTLNNKAHFNNHLQLSWNKYSEENFEFSILEICDEEKLNERERYWIKFYNSTNSKYGYNKTPGGDGVQLFGERNGMYGKQHSPQTKEKISEVISKKMESAEYRQKISNSLKGKKIPEEVKKKISQSSKGQKRSEETKKKISNYQKGKTISHEQKLKLAKITEEQVYQIIDELKKGKKIKDVAIICNTTYKIVHKIKCGATWTHITGGPIIIEKS